MQRDLLEQCIEECRLAARGATRDEDGLARGHRSPEERQRIARRQQVAQHPVVVTNAAPPDVCERPGGGIVREVKIDLDVFADREREVGACRRRRDDLDPFAAGQDAGQQGVCAADALVIGSRDLRRQPGQRRRPEVGHLDALHPGVGVGFDPDLVRPVDQYLCDVPARQPWLERLQERAKIDTVAAQLDDLAHRRAPCSTAKSRSRATKTRTGVPCATLIVGGMSMSRWSAMPASCVACVGEPTVTAPPACAVATR